MKRMGYDFKIMVADIDEKAIRFYDPKKLTLALARAKADALLPKVKGDAILITADQVIVQNGKILEKPKDAKEAEEFLRGYKHHPAEAVTAVVAINTASQKRTEGVDIAKVYFKPMSKEKIREWASSDVVLTCAGGFCINDPSFKEADFYERVEGEIDSVAGLPKALTERLIEEVQ